MNNWKAGEKLLYITGSPAWHAVMTYRGRMGRGGKRGSRGKANMSLQIIHIVVKQKPTQHCKNEKNK